MLRFWRHDIYPNDIQHATLSNVSLSETSLRGQPFEHTDIHQKDTHPKGIWHDDTDQNNTRRTQKMTFSLMRLSTQEN